MKEETKLLKLLVFWLGKADTFKL